ncbi:hypothetical protein BDR06DRAFT_947453 [Suillus hirtellus]|nr:hypothetical protein BDR06DRAFT_947453 [Suillus hirtellus]
MGTLMRPYGKCSGPCEWAMLKEKKGPYHWVASPTQLVQKKRKGHILRGSFFSMVGCVAQLVVHVHCRYSMYHEL